MSDSEDTQVLLVATGKRIRQARRALQMTQMELSARVGVGRSTIIELERGQRKHLNIALLHKIAKATNTTIALLTDSARASLADRPMVSSPTLERVLAIITTLPAAQQEQVGRVLEPLVELARASSE